MIWQRLRSFLTSSRASAATVAEPAAQPPPAEVSAASELQTIAFWRYHARLSFHTPLAYLKRDGQQRTQNPPDLQPIQRTGKGCGEWIPYRPDGFVALAELSQVQIDSWMADSGVEREQKLRLLIRFREIFESKVLHVDQKLMQIYALVDQEAFRSVASSLKGESFPDEVFIAELTTLRGIGLQKAQLLWNAGLRTPAMVQAAEDAELQSIRGIGPKLIAQIRSQEVA